MKDNYLDFVMILERLHRLFLDLLKAELDRLGVRDLNNVQALILYNIGNSQMTVGEISNRGYYLGSNVSYNLKKMVTNGYVQQEISTHDRRSTQIKLAHKGLILFEKLDKHLDQQTDHLKNNGISNEDFKNVIQKCRSLEAYWNFFLKITV
ncbi:MAG: MarR family winged helix-turn-helix transcriptional regulator [Alphaproteobacteria bacterium]